MKDLVSIIMPVYNVEEYLARSIESVLKQTYKTFELIIVDDGSPDNSIYVAKKYAESDDRIKIIRKSNGGLSDARNVGMEYAKGKYIYFIDSDDYIESTLLEKTVGCLERNNSDVIIFGYFMDYVGNDESLKYTNNIFVNTDEYEFNPIGKILDDKNLLPMLGYAWNKLYRREYLVKNENKFTKGVSLIEDILFNEEVLSNTNNIVILKEQLYHYIQRERDTLARTFYKNSYDLQNQSIMARESILKIWKATEDKLNNIVAKQHINGIRFCCSNMFYYKNDLSLIEKYNYIRYMLNDTNTVNRIEKSIPITVKDKIMNITIKYKLSVILTSLYFINSKKYFKVNKAKK